MTKEYVLKGDICLSETPDRLRCLPNGYVICQDGKCLGTFETIPDQYACFEVRDYSNCLIIPGLTDLHVHAPQFSFRAIGMDLELLEWLDTHTFHEEAKYSDMLYASRAYDSFVDDVKKGPNTRICMFATRHVPATVMLMDKLERSGLVTMVGKVNMDRNSHVELQESSAEASEQDTLAWLEQVAEREYKNTSPILTPRFIPSCSDDLMERLSKIQEEYNLPVQSHLSENQNEIAWVKELCPASSSYADAYDHFGFISDKAIMAHCVWLEPDEMELLKKKGTYIAHCPQSNMNLLSGIAPVRKFLRAGIKVGLGSDVAGGVHTSILRSMADAIQSSKLYWRLVDQNDPPLTVEEAFWLGTVGSGSFFGSVGNLLPDYEFDAVVIDDSSIATPFDITIPDRLARVIYLSDNHNIRAKFVKGNQIF